MIFAIGAVLPHVLNDLVLGETFYVDYVQPKLNNYFAVGNKNVDLCKIREEFLSQKYTAARFYPDARGKKCDEFLESVGTQVAIHLAFKYFHAYIVSM